MNFKRGVRKAKEVTTKVINQLVYKIIQQ